MRSIEARWGVWLGHVAFVVAYLAAILAGASVLGALARGLVALLVMFVVGWLIGLAVGAVFQEMLQTAGELPAGDRVMDGDPVSSKREEAPA